MDARAAGTLVAANGWNRHREERSDAAIQKAVGRDGSWIASP
jgi:hypothetical protein